MRVCFLEEEQEENGDGGTRGPAAPYYCYSCCKLYQYDILKRQNRTKIQTREGEATRGKLMSCRRVRKSNKNTGSYSDADVLSEGLETSVRHSFVRKVFSLVGIQLLLTAAIAAPFVMYDVQPFIKNNQALLTIVMFMPLMLICYRYLLIIIHIFLGRHIYATGISSSYVERSIV